jgi:hypothetical protein
MNSKKEFTNVIHVSLNSNFGKIDYISSVKEICSVADPRSASFLTPGSGMEKFISGIMQG